MARLTSCIAPFQFCCWELLLLPAMVTCLDSVKCTSVEISLHSTLQYDMFLICYCIHYPGIKSPQSVCACSPVEHKPVLFKSLNLWGRNEAGDGVTGTSVSQVLSWGCLQYSLSYTQTQNTGSKPRFVGQRAESKHRFSSGTFAAHAGEQLRAGVWTSGAVFLLKQASSLLKLVLQNKAHKEKSCSWKKTLFKMEKSSFQVFIVSFWCCWVWLMWWRGTRQHQSWKWPWKAEQQVSFERGLEENGGAWSLWRNAWLQKYTEQSGLLGDIKGLGSSVQLNLKHLTC